MLKVKNPDFLILLGMGILFVWANALGLLEKYYYFALIPFIASYFIGKFVQQKYGK